MSNPLSNPLVPAPRNRLTSAVPVPGDPMARGWGLERITLSAGVLPPGATARLEWTAIRDTLLLESTARATLGAKTKAIPILSMGVLHYPETPEPTRATVRLSPGTTLTFTVRNTGRKPWRVEVILSARAYEIPVGGAQSVSGGWLPRIVHENSPLVAGNIHSYTLPIPATVLSWELLNLAPQKATVDGIAYRVGDTWRRLELDALGFQAPEGVLALRAGPLPAGTLLQAYTRSPRGPCGWLRLTFEGARAAPTGKNHVAPFGFLPGG